MFDAITAWCERLKLEQRGLVPLASNIQFLCRAYSENKHGNFWDFGLERLIELLQAHFVAQEQALNADGCRHLIADHHSEHERIFGRLLRLRKEYDLQLFGPQVMHEREREMLSFLDEELAEHIFSSDADARQVCSQIGISFP